jgi:hypothetical protein
MPYHPVGVIDNPTGIGASAVKDENAGINPGLFSLTNSQPFCKGDSYGK